MDAHPSAAILQQNVNVLFVLKVVVELHNVPVIEHLVQLDLFINLEEEERAHTNKKQVITGTSVSTCHRRGKRQGLDASKPLQREKGKSHPST